MADIVEFKDGKTGVKMPLQKDKVYIGRGNDNEIVIEDELISKVHAVIEKLSINSDSALCRYTISDLDSTNGTYVNDEAITKSSLWHGDIIRVGMSFFKFIDESTEQQDFSRTTELHKSWIPGIYYTKKKD